MDPRLILDLYGEQPAEPVDLWGGEGLPQMQGEQYPEQSMPQVGNLSQRIQELLGAKEPAEPGLAGGILAGRFNTGGPSYGDYAQGVAKSATGTPQIGSAGGISDQLKQIALLQKLTGAGQKPSAVQEYEYYNELQPQQKQDFLRVKRAQQIMNLGGNLVAYDPVTGDAGQSFAKTPPPQEMPGFKREQAAQTAIGKDIGEKTGNLNSQIAKFPQLESTVLNLSALGRKATYTSAGQTWDEIIRQTGQVPREAAVARAEYISLVDNQVLPLLRDTFGAQFTEREGTSLKITLGDPNKSPEEKEAVLRSFIDQKIANIQSGARELGIEAPALKNPMSAAPATKAPQGQIKFLGYE